MLVKWICEDFSIIIQKQLHFLWSYIYNIYNIFEVTWFSILVLLKKCIHPYVVPNLYDLSVLNNFSILIYYILLFIPVEANLNLSNHYSSPNCHMMIWCSGNIS